MENLKYNNKIKKNKILFVGIFLVLTVFLSCFVSAQDVDLRASLNKKVYFIGDIIEINVEVDNNENNETNVILLIEFETSEGREADIQKTEKYVMIRPYKTYADVINVPAVIGEYFARVLIKNSRGIILQEQNLGFSVLEQPLFINIKTCKDENCKKTSSKFLLNEEIVLFATVQEGAFIEGKCITPEGDSFNLNFADNKAHIVSDRIGEHIVVITATKEKQIQEETISFTIKQKSNSKIIFVLLSILLIIVIIVIITILIIKRKKVL